MEFLINKYNFIICIILMMIGLYAMISKKNLIKKIIGMNVFQTAIFLFFISISYKKNATSPILLDGAAKSIDYTNPLPHVLVLTAIVVAVATSAVALSLIIKIYQEYGSIEEDNLNDKSSTNNYSH